MFDRTSPTRKRCPRFACCERTTGVRSAVLIKNSGPPIPTTQVLARPVFTWLPGHLAPPPERLSALGLVRVDPNG